MDPTATWQAMQQAIVAENWEQARELADALLTWLRRNGFPPLIGSKDLPNGWRRALAEAGAHFVLATANSGRSDGGHEGNQ